MGSNELFDSNIYGADISAYTGMGAVEVQANSNQVIFNEGTEFLDSTDSDQKAEVSVFGAKIYASSDEVVRVQTNDNAIVFNQDLRLDGSIIVEGVEAQLKRAEESQLEAIGNQIIFNDEVDIEDVKINGVDVSVYPSTSGEENVNVVIKNNAIIFNQNALLDKTAEGGSIVGVDMDISETLDAVIDASENQIVFNGEVEFGSTDINGIKIEPLSSEGSVSIKANNNEVVFNQNASFDKTAEGGSIVGVTMDIQKTLDAVIDASENQIVFNGEVEFGTTDIDGIKIEPMSTEGSAHIKANNNEIVFNQDITHDGGTIIGVTVGADSANTPQISSLREFVVEASNNQITFNKAVEIFNNLDIQVVRVGDIDDVYSQDTNSVEMVQIATNGNSLSLGGGSEFALNTGTSGVENSNIGTSQIYASSYMDTGTESRFRNFESELIVH